MDGGLIMRWWRYEPEQVRPWVQDGIPLWVKCLPWFSRHRRPGSINAGTDTRKEIHEQASNLN